MRLTSKERRVGQISGPASRLKAKFRTSVAHHDRTAGNLASPAQRFDFLNFVAAVPDAVLLIDANLNIVFANEVAEDLYGYSSGDLGDRRLTDLIAPENAAAAVTRIRRLLSGELRPPGTIERRTRRKDGVWIWVEASVARWASLEGTFVVSVHRDVTKRRESEEALRRSRESLNEAQRLAGVGSFERDFVENKVEWSDEARRIWGFAEGSPASFDIVTERVHPEDRTRFVMAREHALRNSEEAVNCNFRIVLSSGMVRSIYSEYNAVRDAFGRTTRLRGTVQDVTERQQMEDAIRRSREGLARAQRIAGMGSFEHDLTTGWTTWSEELWRIFGFAPEAKVVPSRDAVLAIVHPADRKKFQLEAFGDSPGTPAISETFFRIVRPDGAVRDLHRHTEVVRDQMGRPGSLYGTVQDITERRAVENELSRSQEDLTRAQRIARIGSFGRDLVTGETEWSKEFLRIWGLPEDTVADSVSGGRLLDMVHPADQAAYTAGRVRALKVGNAEPLDFRIRRPNGEERILHREFGVISDETGQPLRLFGTVQDVTELKRAEIALRRSQENLERAQRIANVGNFMIDVVTGEIELSKQIFLIHGVKPDTPQATLAFLRGLVHPEDLKAVAEFRLRTQRGERANPIEYRILRPDGAERVLHRECDVEVDASGRTTAIFGTVQDVTELKRAEIALRDYAARLGAILDCALDGIVTMNADGRIESFNPAAEKIFDRHAEEALGRPVAELMEAPYGDGFHAELGHRTAAGEPAFRGGRREVVGMRRDGGTFPLEIAATEVRLGTERIFVALMRDLSEQRKVERMKTEFVSTVSHELRTPLTSISASLALLSRIDGAAFSGRGRHLVDVANASSERLVRLINDLLDVEKVESGSMKLHLAPVSLRTAVTACIDANRSFAAQAGIRLLLDTTTVDGEVMGDKDRLMQLFTNLVSNAVKFSPSGGVVTLGVTRHHKMMRVSVRDEGAGVPEAFHDRIFQKFAQADSSDARPRGGTGLGLAIAKSIAERHGGAISFKNRRDGGAAFHVDFPECRAVMTAENPVQPADLRFLTPDRSRQERAR